MYQVPNFYTDVEGVCWEEGFGRLFPYQLIPFIPAVISCSYYSEKNSATCYSWQGQNQINYYFSVANPN